MWVARTVNSDGYIRSKVASPGAAIMRRETVVASRIEPLSSLCKRSASWADVPPLA